MDDQPPQVDQQPAADTKLSFAGVMRELFDLNTIYESDKPGRLRWWVVRLVLFGIGSWIGGLIWRVVHAESEDNRALWQSLLTNAYFWAGLLATGCYAIYDRRVRRSAR
ncbi:hypothetical protein [Kribbella sp. CA-293567]|uniref:hypothetical protein n=1 Tax=Kribbella sp. CA-293567 TaxID=3002436 RepID=UPI0022DD8AAC|nr:hypothetical protein [Kribbella sp. CA-293567]WBQ06833.1 hypothetical protein OX958_08565 [Kribbella sp. CA-293567]